MARIVRPEDLYQDSPFMAQVRQQVSAMRRAEFEASPQLSLGELIEQLEGLRKLDEAGIRFDFGYVYPTGFHSYRGFYEELAIGWRLESKNRKAKDFLDEARTAVGAEFHGYKGGDYVMSRDTPVWVANTSDAPSTIVVGVHDSGFEAVILTAFQEG